MGSFLLQNACSNTKSSEVLQMEFQMFAGKLVLEDWIPICFKANMVEIVVVVEAWCWSSVLNMC